MQIVIDIPQYLVYEGFERPFTEEEKNFFIKAIGNGTPLPGRYGRLIDADELLEHVWRDKLDSRKAIAKMVKSAPTIIN